MQYLRGIIELEQLKEKLKELRKGKKIVFTNGCFDLLHAGHIEYLSEAKTLGDLLIVGLNSDSSIRALKGSCRPVIPLEARAKVLAALRPVDIVVPFSDLTAEKLVKEIKPDIYVKGGDYHLEELPEARAVRDYGGEIKILRLTPGWSTSKIINRILQLFGPEQNL